MGDPGRDQDRGARVGENNGPKVKPVKFEGATEELKGHIFDCAGHDQSDLFTKTCKKLEIFAGTQCGGSMAAAVELMKEPKAAVTPDPARPARGTDDPWAKVDPSDKDRWRSQDKEAAKEVTIVKLQSQKLHSVVGPNAYVPD